MTEGNTNGCAVASARTVLRGRRPWHARTLFAREPGDLQFDHLRHGWSASGRRGAEADDARAREVRPLHSSCETGEQFRTIRSGVDGAKGGAEGSTREPHTHRTRSRASVSPGLERVRKRARQEKKERFTALLHHVSVDLLRTAYSRLKRDAAPGVDGMTWREYGQDLEARLVDLHPTGCGFPNPVEIVLSPLKAMNFNQDWHQDRDH